MYEILETEDGEDRGITLFSPEASIYAALPLNTIFEGDYYFKVSTILAYTISNCL